MNITPSLLEPCVDAVTATDMCRIRMSKCNKVL